MDFGGKVPNVRFYSFWSFAGGRGVAPGVKPEKCSRCKGLGTVSFAWKKKSEHFYGDKN